MSRFTSWAGAAGASAVASRRGTKRIIVLLPNGGEAAPDKIRRFGGVRPLLRLEFVGSFSHLRRVEDPARGVPVHVREPARLGHAELLGQGSERLPGLAAVRRLEDPLHAGRGE